MVIELNERESDEFYKEAVNIMLQAANMWKNPRYRFKNMYRRFTARLIGSLVLLAVFAVLAIINKPDILTVIGIVSMAAVSLINVAVLVNMRLRWKNLKDSFAPETLTLDDGCVGLLKNDGSSASKKAWDQFACVLISPHTVAFIPTKRPDAIVVFVPGEFENEICAWLREHRPDVLTVKQDKI